VSVTGDDYVDLQPTFTAVLASGFTWELWFKGDALPTSMDEGRGQILLGAMDTSPCEDVYLGFGTPNSPRRELAFNLDGDGDCAASNTDPLRHYPAGGYQNGVWYHVAVAVDYQLDLATLYLDGALVAQKQTTAAPLFQAMNFNAGRFFDGNSADAYFEGAIDDIRVYGAPLPLARIQEHYDSGNGQPGDPDEPDLLHGWRFDEGSGILAGNYVVGSPTAVLANGAQWTSGIVPLP
jgi:hypothetical protein